MNYDEQTASGKMSAGELEEIKEIVQCALLDHAVIHFFPLPACLTNNCRVFWAPDLSLQFRVHLR